MQRPGGETFAQPLHLAVEEDLNKKEKKETTASNKTKQEDHDCLGMAVYLSRWRIAVHKRNTRKSKRMLA